MIFSRFFVKYFRAQHTNFSSSSSLISLPLLTTTIVFALTALCGFALFRRIANARGDDNDIDFLFCRVNKARISRAERTFPPKVVNPTRFFTSLPPPHRARGMRTTLAHKQ
jgi:hypothetical protein